MRVGSVLEGLEVFSDGLGVDALGDRPLLEQHGVVDSLCAGQDLLAPHEEVVGAGEVGVVLTQHGVEGTRGDRVPVEHVEVGVVLVLD